MHLQKTDKAVLELASRQRTLGLKERALLLLADGRKTDAELLAMVQTEPDLIDTLVRSGHLERLNKAPSPPATPSTRPAPAATERPPTRPEQRSAPPVDSGFAVSALDAGPGRVAADTFDGKRSLATTRMFLFDLTERLFSRRNPPLALLLRERLRQARDRESMLAVARDLLAHIEDVAGPARADEVSSRLAMLLPDEVAA